MEKGLDVGFAYDGDADRCLAVDERGRVVDGDQILYVCGVYLNKHGRLSGGTVVPTIASNFGLIKSLELAGLSAVTSGVGDRHVYAKMREGGYSLGGEQTGHTIFGDIERTGDGIMTSLRVMEVIRAERETLSQLTAPCKLLPQAQVSAERINEVLERKANIREGSVSECKEHGTVEFKNVSFRYPHASEDELSNISFRVNRGETLAVIGATGSGKTTLVSLIPRFYDATEGEVLVDGVNVRDYTFDTLYNKLGYVTQKAVLFAGSIRDNVYFGESEAPADDEGLAQAVELSQAKEFVDKLPDGTQHHVAQMGRNMSGGQKQRLSIARALARKPEILVFDDSFSALDYRTDAKLREGLSKQLHDTTKIIVAQRISTIRHADKIIVLDRGETVGIGTHEELMKNCDVYREIATSQLSAAELA